MSSKNPVVSKIGVRIIQIGLYNLFNLITLIDMLLHCNPSEYLILVGLPRVVLSFRVVLGISAVSLATPVFLPHVSTSFLFVYIFLLFFNHLFNT